MSDFIIRNAAQQASQRSIDAVRSKNKAAWVNNFAEDGCIEDPVGVSMLDATGNGHTGHAAIGAFWDMFIGGSKVDFVIRESFPSGTSAVANVGAVVTTLDDGSIIEAKGVFIYHVNADGKVSHLRAYWDFDSTMAAIKKPEAVTAAA